jgi:hypothetical protein
MRTFEDPRTDFENWRNNIALNEKRIIIGNLKSALNFLSNNRHAYGGWSYQKGESITDLHLSALSLEAIKLSNDPDPDSQFILQNAIPYFRDLIKDGLDNFDEEKLADSLNINIILGQSTQEIMSKLLELRQENGWVRPDPSLGLTCTILIALMNIEDSPKEIIKKFIDRLIREQNEDGGWPSVRANNSEIIPTCYVLRALFAYNDKTIDNNIAKGLNFLAEALKKDNWINEQDTFVVAILLRTIGEIGGIDFRIVKSIMDSFYQRINSDGGWGLAKGLPSEIEYTALAVIALISMGKINLFLRISFMQR